MPRLSLTPGLITRVPPAPPVEGGIEGRPDRPTEADWAGVVDMLLAGAPESGEVWIFAYGSLIWRPEFAFDSELLGTVHGWHRSFCLGWVRLYRGTAERPGIMLSLDRGGACRGVIFRLPEGRQREELLNIIRREMPIRWQNVSVRWMTVRTERGPIRAIGFPISRHSPVYLPDLTEETVVNALATAAGERGSMAEYLASTVAHLEERGIHDAYLWRLQRLVAEAIERHWPDP